LVVICGRQNYQLDIKPAIDGVVAEGMREGEVRGLIPNNCVAREFCAKNAAVAEPPKLLGPHAPVLVSKTSDCYACAPDNLTGSV
jgi:hypothetical protein